MRHSLRHVRGLPDAEKGRRLVRVGRAKAVAHRQLLLKAPKQRVLRIAAVAALQPNPTITRDTQNTLTVERDTESLTPATRIYSMMTDQAAALLFTLLYSWRLRQLFKTIHTFDNEALRIQTGSCVTSGLLG